MTISACSDMNKSADNACAVLTRSSELTKTSSSRVRCTCTPSLLRRMSRISRAKEHQIGLMRVIHNGPDQCHLPRVQHNHELIRIRRIAGLSDSLFCSWFFGSGGKTVLIRFAQPNDQFRLRCFGATVTPALSTDIGRAKSKTMRDQPDFKAPARTPVID